MSPKDAIDVADALRRLDCPHAWARITRGRGPREIHVGRVCLACGAEAPGA